MMKACLLEHPAPVETNPLKFIEVEEPEPAGDQILIRVSCCAVCRTDLHVVEGELRPRKSPVIPGHQVVGVVENAGGKWRPFSNGARVGVAWPHHVDGHDAC